MSTSKHAGHIKRWLGGALAVAAVAGGVFMLAPPLAEAPANGGQLVHQPGSVAGQVAPAATAAGAVPARPGAAAPGNTWFDPVGPGSMPVAPIATLATPSPLSTMAPPHFAADSRGKLVLNSDTHANLEKLLLEEDPAAQQAMLANITSTLPPQAAAELKALVGQFQQYAKALSHSINPENAPENAREGFKLLDSLHTLRVSYLGPEAARAMFGPEEATTRQLIALMEAEKDPGLTPQQKAERAQEILSRQAPPPG